MKREYRNEITLALLYYIHKQFSLVHLFGIMESKLFRNGFPMVSKLLLGFLAVATRSLSFHCSNGWYADVLLRRLLNV